MAAKSYFLPGILKTLFCHFMNDVRVHDIDAIAIPSGQGLLKLWPVDYFDCVSAIRRHFLIIEKAPVLRNQAGYVRQEFQTSS